MNILLVEPDKILGENIQQSIEAHGYSVVWRRSAQTALDALDQTLPDLIIIEIQLGIHNGIEFLYEIRSYNEWQQIPVIIHTINNKALGEMFKPALNSLNVQEVLYKPRTKVEQLVKAVKQLVPTPRTSLPSPGKA